MRRLLAILLIPWAYTGCAERGSVHGLPPQPAPGGALRFQVEDDAVAGWMRRGAVGRPLIGEHVLEPVAWTSGNGSGGVGEGTPACARVTLDPASRWPDGTPVRAEDWLAAWEASLRDPREPHRWLLGPVDGSEAFVVGLADRVRGLRPADGTLELCFERPAPDLEARLGHPALWLSRRAASTGYLEGPGPFVETGGGALVPNARFAGAAPSLQRIERIDTADPSLLLRVGEIDLAVVFGRTASELVAAAAPRLSISRAPGLDRTYFLWLNPRARWLNDPRFRRWLAARIDRGEMLRHLFDLRGSVAWGLLEPAGRAWAAVEARPLSRTSQPRIRLDYAVDDRAAAGIAERLKAELEAERVELEPRPRHPGELAAALRSGDFDAAVLVHRVRAADPVLVLAETLHTVGSLPDSVGGALHRAELAADPALRRTLAAAVEGALTSDGTLIPLVRLDAWLARDARLVGVGEDTPGLLRFDAAGWLP